MIDLTDAENEAVQHAMVLYHRVAAWRKAASERGGGQKAGGHRGQYRGMTPFDALEAVATDERRLGLLASAVIEMATEGQA